MSCSAPKLTILDYLDENTLFTTLILFTFLVIGVFIYLWKCYLYFEKQGISRVVRPRAPFGNIKDIVFQKVTIYEYFCKYHNKFKKSKCRFGGLYMFTKPAVLLVDKEIIKRLIDENSNANNGINLLNENKIKTYVLKNYKSFQMQLVADLKADSYQDALRSFIVNVSCLTFGIENIPLLSKFIQDYNASNFHYYLSLVYPLFKRSNYWSFILKNELNLRKKNDINKQDVLQNITNNSDNALNKLFECFINSVNHSLSVVTMCLLELSLNKSVQDDLIGELRRFGKEFNELTVENVDQLPYLEAVVQETLRKYPPVPVFIQRYNHETKTDFGFKMLKDGFIAVSTYGIHHDPENFINPEEFDVDRFLDSNSKFDMFYPFGFDCSNKTIGSSITSFIAKLCIYIIFSHFRVEMTTKVNRLFDTKRLGIFPRKSLPLRFQTL